MSHTGMNATEKSILERLLAHPQMLDELLRRLQSEEIVDEQGRVLENKSAAKDEEGGNSSRNS